MNRRIGKIARLPRAVREELNERLLEGEGGEALLEWLNGLPEVQRVMAAEFGRKPINAQNLSAWRQGGYEDWVAHGEAMELAQRLGEEIQDWQESEQADRAASSEKLMVWLTARYAVTARQVGKLDEEAAWQRLREFAADMLKLRKVEQNERRLRLVEEKAGVERKAQAAGEKKERELDKEYQNWRVNQELERIRLRLLGPNSEDVPRPTAEATAGNEALAVAQSGGVKSLKIEGNSSQFNVLADGQYSEGHQRTAKGSEK